MPLVVAAERFFDAREVARVEFHTTDLLDEVTTEPAEITVRWFGSDYSKPIGATGRHMVVERKR